MTKPDEAHDPAPCYDPQLHYEVEVELAGRLRDAPSAEARRGLYRTIYDERIRRIPAHPLEKDGHSDADRARQVRAQLRLLEKLQLLTPETRFLEVGPGDCALAFAVAHRVAHVAAVDVSDSLRPSGAAPPNVDFRLSDGVSVPVEPAAFDVGYSNQVLEHLHPDDVLDHLRNVRRALRPGGVFVCVTPNRLSGPWDISRRFNTHARGLHLREYTITEGVELLRRSGFASVSCVASAGGWRLTPRFGPAPIAFIERRLERLPYGTRRRLAIPLTTVKLVATSSTDH